MTIIIIQKRKQFNTIGKFINLGKKAKRFLLRYTLFVINESLSNHFVVK